MVLLVCTNSVPYIASLSLFATLFYYIIGIAAAWGLRRRQPQLTRTYRAPGICLGVPLSILCYAFMMSQLDLAAIGAGLLWCLFGLLLTALCRKKRPPLQQPNFATLLPPPPSIQEKYRLDQQFCRWRNVVCIAVLAVCGLYVLILFIWSLPPSYLKSIQTKRFGCFFPLSSHIYENTVKRQGSFPLCDKTI